MNWRPLQEYVEDLDPSILRRCVRSIYIRVGHLRLLGEVKFEYRCTDSYEQFILSYSRSIFRKLNFCTVSKEVLMEDDEVYVQLATVLSELLEVLGPYEKSRPWNSTIFLQYHFLNCELASVKKQTPNKGRMCRMSCRNESSHHQNSIGTRFLACSSACHKVITVFDFEQYRRGLVGRT